VVALRVEDEDWDDDVDIRALDATGAVVDSTAAWHAEREASVPGVTVAEALALPDGSAVTVHGTLLALAGQTPLLCDGVDPGPRPKCRGVGLQLVTDAPLPPTEFGDGFFSAITVVATGIVSAGSLTPSLDTGDGP
jgi:hypothetical protein